MGGRRGRIAVVLGPLLALLLLLAVRPGPQQAGDVTPASPAPAVAASPTASASPAADAPEGTVPVLASRAKVSGCPSGNALTGDCGTVAGFTGWYGSWKTAGGAGAFCLEHAKKEPAQSLSYSKHATAEGYTTMSGEDRERLGYLLERYGDTTDATTAAALAILVHAAQGDTLTTGQLATYETDLPAAVQTKVGALWSEAGADHGPYTASMVVVAAGGGARATLTVHSASGNPMGGFPVSWAGSSHGDEVTTTTSTGTATLTVATVAPGNTVTAHAQVSGLPAADVAVWVPTDSTVQSVAVALPVLSASATGSYTAAQVASLQLVKTTTDQAYVSPRGAVFRVTDAAGDSEGSLTTDDAGHSNLIGGLAAAAGPFTVTEITPCDGCTLAPPQQVAIAPGQAAVVTVQDAVPPAQLALRKTTPGGAPLAGAVLHLRRASVAGGGFDQDLGTCTSGADGACVVPGQSGIAPGDLQVTEDQPAPGTTWAVPRVQTVPFRTGAIDVAFADPALTTVGFRKAGDAAGSSVDHDHESLAGTVFAVSGPALPTATGADPAVVELSRCTTAADASCALPGTPLVEGVAYSWREVAAPPGFALDPASHPFTACALPCDAGTITASDQGRYAAVLLRKHVAGDDTTPVPGATVDLCATGLPAALGVTYAAPAGSTCAAPATWVASGMTDARGGIAFGLLPPGTHYCAVERTAPAGFELDQVPVCGDLVPAGSATDAAPTPLTLDLAEQRTPPPASPPVSSPTPSAPAPRLSSAVPRPTTHVLAVASVRPSARPRVRRTQLVVPPTAPLAFTGTEHVGNAVELAFGLIALGLALLRSSWGSRGSPRPGRARRSRG